MRNPTYGDNPAMNAPQPYPAPYPQAATAPAYPQPMHPGVYLQPWQQSVQPQMPPVYPQGYAAQPHPAAPMQPAPYWAHPQMMPQPGYPYGQPGAVHAGMYAPQPGYGYPQSAMPMVEAEPAVAAEPEQSQIDEIRASLRECRDAIRELTEQRAKRRYF